MKKKNPITILIIIISVSLIILSVSSIIMPDMKAVLPIMFLGGTVNLISGLSGLKKSKGDINTLNKFLIISSIFIFLTGLIILLK